MYRDIHTFCTEICWIYMGHILYIIFLITDTFCTFSAVYKQTAQLVAVYKQTAQLVAVYKQTAQLVAVYKQTA